MGIKGRLFGSGLGSENWKMGATKGGDQSRIGTREDGRRDLSWDPVPLLKLRALTSLSAVQGQGYGEFGGDEPSQGRP